MSFPSKFLYRQYFLAVSHTIDMTHSSRIYSGSGVCSSSPRLSKYLALACRILRGIVVFAGCLGMSRRAAAACRSFAIGAACIGIHVVDTEAAVTFSNPTRSVFAGNNKGSSREIISNDFGQFNESARVDWEEYWSYPNSFLGQYPNTTGQYYSTATHESIIGLSGIAARGSVLGTGSFDFYGENPLLQNSHSYFKIDILLDAPGNIYLNGLIRLEKDPWGTNLDNPEIFITLGENGEHYSKIISPSNYLQTYEYEINESFISLPSGEYEFVVSLKTSGRYDADEISYDETGVWIQAGAGGYGSATYEITLVPEPSYMTLGVLSCLMFVASRKRPPPGSGMATP